MKKIISFCLFGNDPKYCIGAVRNAQLAPQIYSGWTTRFYCGNSVPRNIISRLLACNNRLKEPKDDGNGNIFWEGDCTEVFDLNKHGDHRMMLDRFTAIEDADVAVMLSRDTDSRLSLREKLAADEWIASDKGWMCIRDHPFHSVPILGGLWGVKKQAIVPEVYKQLLNSWPAENRLQTDQEFLSSIIWARYNKDFLCFDDGFYTQHWGGTPISMPRTGLDFLGETFDEKDLPNQSHREALQKWLIGHHKKTI